MLLLLVAVLCMTTTISLATDVKVLPLGVTKEFVCTTPPETDYGIVWLVNGTAATNPLFQDYIVLGEEVHSESELQRSLTFTAYARANNTHILCTATYYDNGEINTLVLVDMTLALQGQLPAPVVTYKMSRDYHSAMFSWSAPFSLNISDMDPDILHYVVYIISDDGHIDAMNETDTHYELQADPCQSHQYHVAIAAVNVVGEGEKYMSPEINLQEYAVAHVSDATVSFNSRVVLIQLTLEASPQCHDPGFVLKYGVECNATYLQDRPLLSSAGQNTLNLNSNEDSLKMNEIYNCFIRIEGLQNSESTMQQLRTFDVQDVSTITRDQISGYVNITCHFARGSDAKGCRIVVQNSATSCEIVAAREERDESTVTVALPSGTYTLLAYDYEDEGDNNPAFNTTLTVHSSAQVSECPIVQSKNSRKSVSTNYLIVIVSPTSGVILIAVVATAIIFTCVRKYKNKKHLPPNTKDNYYTSSPVQQSSSSESTDSSSVSSGSVSSGQSPGVHSTGRSYDLQYADVRVPRKHTMARPPPTSNDEPVTYALLQHQDTSSHTNKTQDAGQLPGSYTPDDSN